MTTTRRRRPLLLAPLVAALLLAVAAQGCYTLMRHPGIPSLNYRRPPADHACTSCHSQAELLASLMSERIDAEPGPWGSLSHPWWVHPSPDSTRSDGGPLH